MNFFLLIFERTKLIVLTSKNFIFLNFFLKGLEILLISQKKFMFLNYQLIYSNAVSENSSSPPLIFSSQALFSDEVIN